MIGGDERRSRPSWSALPEAVRERVAAVIGGSHVADRAVHDGFSAGFAGRVETTRGVAFVKAIAADGHADTLDLYRAEAEAYFWSSQAQPEPAALRGASGLPARTGASGAALAERAALSGHPRSDGCPSRPARMPGGGPTPARRSGLFGRGAPRARIAGPA